MKLNSTYTHKLLSFLLIVCASGTFFYNFRSLWLDDWDSVLFARALDELDILKHQPHPPGYVAYVYTARIFYLFLGEPEFSLILCSVLSGALTLGLVYLLGTILVNSITGWLWSGYLFCIPAFTLTSTVAMADIVVLPFYVGSVICFVQGTRHGGKSSLKTVWPWLLAGGLLMGWGVGVRPQWIFLFAITALFFSFRMPKANDRMVSVAAGVGGTLAWLLPVSIKMGGITSYLSSIGKQYSDHEIYRAKFTLGNLYDYARLGRSDWETSFALAVALSIFSLCVIVWKRKQFELPRSISILAVIAITLLATGIGTTLWFHPLEYKRVLAPASLPFAFLIALPQSLMISRNPTLAIISGGRLLIAVSLCIGILATFNRSKALHESVPPPILAADYIREHFDPAQTSIAAGLSTVHWGYYLPREFRTIYRELPEWSPASHEDSHVYLSAEPLVGESWDDLIVFERSKSIYSKHHRVELYVYRNNNYNVHLDNGTFGWGIWNGFWTTDTFGGWIRQNLRGESELVLRVRSGMETPRLMQVFLDESDNPVWSSDIGTENGTLKIPLPLSREWSRIRITTPDGCIVPAEVGSSNDFRCLSFAISSINVGAIAYKLGESLYPNLEQIRREFMGNGWAGPEDWGIWTLGSRAEIQVPLAERPRNDLRLQLNGRSFHHPELHPETSIRISANDVLVFEDVIRVPEFMDYTVRIPASAIAQDANLKIAFEIGNPISPTELGIGEDDRKLGFALTKLKLENW